MSREEIELWRCAIHLGLDPPLRAKAPPIARLHPGEHVLRPAWQKYAGMEMQHSELTTHGPSLASRSQLELAFSRACITNEPLCARTSADSPLQLDQSYSLLGGGVALVCSSRCPPLLRTSRTPQWLRCTQCAGPHPADPSNSARHGKIPCRSHCRQRWHSSTAARHRAHSLQGRCRLPQWATRQIKAPEGIERSAERHAGCSKIRASGSLARSRWQQQRSAEEPPSCRP